ncbi:M1 family aminopeptidase [Flavobacterium sp. LC2016-01]|uniref:M1 family aminopeptidase n=1 Tax=Flavobacterium sp. LC2016-01 TaxID=2675876 RepID=UPI0012BAA48D|nr:M1 family aminopeptidase [Flavobacterium sp. LC2016-01]MTH15827.1 hypothetical protein [Flavobacterium sp. LC2016-01]
MKNTPLLSYITIKNKTFSFVYGHLFLILFLFTCIISSAQQKISKDNMDYHLSWDGSSSTLKVDLNYYVTAEKDSTVFIYGDLVGGQNAIFKVLSNIYAPKDDQISIVEADRKIIVHHQKSGWKKLHYEIDGTLVIDAKRALPNELFRPVISKGSFYIIGYNLFLDAANRSYKNVSIVWDSFPVDMPYFISVSPEAKPNNAQVIEFGKRKDVLMVMESDLIIKKYNVYGSPYYAITSKRDTLLDMQKQIRPYFDNFFPTTRNFWKDYSKEYYYLCILPLFNDVASTRTGMNLGNGFTMKYSGSFDLLKKEVIAHETSHSWIGHGLKFKSSAMENLWFSEGFNDYISIFNLAGSTMIDKNEFLTYLNQNNLRPHYTSPVNTAPSDSIAKYFWKDGKYEKLSYQRGFIYAFYLDNQIRLSSKGKYNIRAFLLDLFNENKGSKRQLLTIDDFASAASRYLPKEQVETEVKSYMLDGKLIDFSKVRLVNEFTIKIIDGIPVLEMSEDSNLQTLFKWQD